MQKFFLDFLLFCWKWEKWNKFVCIWNFISIFSVYFNLNYFFADEIVTARVSYSILLCEFLSTQIFFISFSIKFTEKSAKNKRSEEFVYQREWQGQ